MTGWSGGWYRRQALKRAGLHTGMSVLDVAIGTGLVARQACRLVGPLGRVVGVDPSVGMRRLARDSLGIETMDGVAETLPVDDGVFDFVSMGYALRHVSDLGSVFAEFLRVLRAGGRVCILEITRPRTAVGRGLLRSYLSSMCAMARATRRSSPRTRELWEYYWETIDRCVPPETITGMLGAAGFREARRGVELGVFSEFTAVKP